MISKNKKEKKAKKIVFLVFMSLITVGAVTGGTITIIHANNKITYIKNNK